MTCKNAVDRLMWLTLRLEQSAMERKSFPTDFTGSPRLRRGLRWSVPMGVSFTLLALVVGPGAVTAGEEAKPPEGTCVIFADSGEQTFECDVWVPHQLILDQLLEAPGTAIQIKPDPHAIMARCRGARTRHCVLAFNDVVYEMLAAAAEGRVEFLASALDAGIHPNSYVTGLGDVMHASARERCFECVKLASQYGYAMDSPFRLRSGNGYWEIACLQVEWKAPHSEEMKSLLGELRRASGQSDHC
jgi:hypothetical protein